MKTEDLDFIDFVSKCIELDPELRLSAKEALEHPFLHHEFQSPKKERYLGKGTLKAVDNVNERIADELIDFHTPIIKK